MAIKQRPLTFRPLHLDVMCDVCNKGRGHGNHQKCSRIRQKRNAWKWVEDDALNIAANPADHTTGARP